MRESSKVKGPENVFHRVVTQEENKIFLQWAVILSRTRVGRNGGRERMNRQGQRIQALHPKIRKKKRRCCDPEEWKCYRNKRMICRKKKMVKGGVESNRLTRLEKMCRRGTV